ncbi:MAG TPA: hypothetical protein VGV61_00910 [Thermoanaerobaculia bacterium]|jgi:hypothetical protein|nr:hypothetical protein [Thermoanaerobaculia bacterium]
MRRAALAFALATFAVLSTCSPAVATSVTRAAGAVAVVSGNWNTPSEATTRNNACAGSFGGVLTLGSYGFTLPADATVTGVAVTLWATSPVGNPDTGLVLSRPGGASPSRALDAPTGSAFPFTCGSASVASGADGDLWGFTSPALSPTDVNDPAFGVQVTGSGNEAIDAYRLDAALITIFYTQPPPPPGAPTSLIATSQQNKVALAWTDGSSDESDFRVERGPDASGVPGTFAEIGSSAATPPGTPAFDDTTAACNTTYWYRVRAFRASDSVFSSYSNNASVTHVCPDLTVTKSASAATVLTDQPWTWTLQIANGGSGPATSTAGQAVLSDMLPLATYGTPVVTPDAGVTGTVACTVASGTLGCTASNTVTLPAGKGVSVAVQASSSAPGPLINGGSGCLVDPGGLLTETIEANNGCNSSTVTVRSVLIFKDGFEAGTLPGPWGGYAPH